MSVVGVLTHSKLKNTLNDIHMHNQVIIDALQQKKFKSDNTVQNWFQKIQPKSYNIVSMLFENNYYSKKNINLTIWVAKYLNFYFPWNHCASESSPTIARVISSALHSRDWGAFSDWFPLCFLHREIDFCYVHNPNYYLSINPYYIKLYYRREWQSDDIFWEKRLPDLFFRKIKDTTKSSTHGLNWLKDCPYQIGEFARYNGFEIPLVLKSTKRNMSETNLYADFWEVCKYFAQWEGTPHIVVSISIWIIIHHINWGRQENLIKRK